MVVIADLLVLVGALPRRESHDKLMSQLPSPKVTGLSSSPVLERAPGRDGVGGQCNLAGGTKWGRKLGGARSGAVSATCLGGRAQRWAVSAASTWRRGRPGPCPHHAWAVERSDGLCRRPACGAERGQGAVSASCLGGGRVQRRLCAASMRRGARPGGAVSASCFGGRVQRGLWAASMRRGPRQGVGSSLRVVVRGFWAAEHGQRRLSGPPVGAVSAHPALLGGYRGLGSRARLRR